MQVKAAPGQLSVRELHTLRHLIGTLPARRYYLLGFPTARSLSPTMHNAGFQVFF